MKRAARIIPWLVLWLGSLAITLSSLIYFIPDEIPAFVIEKLPLPAESLYILTLRFHVAAAAVALPGCLLLSSKVVLKRWPRFHRRCGRIVGSIILGVLAPTGFYLALFARGGWAGTLGFWLTGAIVMVAMLQGIRAARLRRYAEHRRLTFHVLGQLSVAVSSRAMLFGLESLNFNPDSAYLIALWIPVVGTFALVECLVAKTPVKFFFRRPYEQTLHFPGALRGRRAELR